MTQKAGAIILSKQNPEQVLVLFQPRYQDWSFPKGHVDSGEEIEEAALREVLEETGLQVDRLSKLETMRYQNVKDGDIDLELFLVRSKDDSTLKIEYEGNELVWIDYRLIADKVSYENLKVWYQENFDAIEKVIHHLLHPERSEGSPLIASSLGDPSVR